MTEGLLGLSVQQDFSLLLKYYWEIILNWNVLEGVKLIALYQSHVNSVKWCEIKNSKEKSQVI